MKQKLITLFLALAASVGTLFAQSGICGNYLTWTFDNGTLTISGTGDMYNYEYYDFYDPVGSSAPWNSYRSSITKVVINSGVSTIGHCAFCGCINLTSITIPNSVTSVGQRAFYDCISLPVINNIRYADTYLVEAVDVTLSSYEIKEGTRFIGDEAFYCCTGLTSITIPNGVTSIGSGVFIGCNNLISITIPNSMTSIGKYTFSGVPNVVYSGTATGAPWGARCLNGYVERNLVYRDSTKTELLVCSIAATEITIPNTVTSIGMQAFLGCSNLTSITIPNSVTSIGYEAFCYCMGLTSITISKSVTSIGYSAFHHCDNLEDIFVPCDELLDDFKQMFGEGGNSVYVDALKVSPSPPTLTVKDTKYGSVSVPDYNGCDDSIMITAIPDPHCRFVKWSDGSTDNPRSVYLTEDITLEAFFVDTLTDKCGKDYLLTWTLDTLKMSLNILGRGSLTDNYTYGSFIKSLIIGNEVASIGTDAFSDCNNIKDIIFGSALKIIESGAFACSDIKTITCYSKRPPTVNDGAFCDLDYSTIVYVLKDYVEAYETHDFWQWYDIHPIGASGTETDQVKVEPAETTATVAWPTINGAGSYELVIRDKDGNALCTLVFNAQGQLTSIDFAAAPARDRSNIAAKAQGAGFAFTVTGLESGTMYKYSFITKNASGTVIDTKTGAFTTQSPTALEDIMDDASSSSVRKVLQNGQLYILRDGKVYNATGAEVK